jgi:hypothetical protein
LGLGRQLHPLAGLLGQPAAELFGLLPGDTRHGLRPAIDRMAPVGMVLVGHADVGAVVSRVEQGELRIGGLELGHVEGPFDLHAMRRILVHFAVGTAHDETSGGDQYQLQPAAVGQFDHPLRFARCRLAPFRFGRIERPIGAGHTADGPGRQRGGFHVRHRLHGPVHLDDLFRVFGTPGIGGSHLQTPLFCSCQVPWSGTFRSIQVISRSQASASSLHAVMSLAEHLDQLAGRSVELQRPLQCVVALRARPAYKRVQGHVGRREILPAGRAVDAQIGRFGRSIGLGAVMAADAVPVQHRLDLALEAEAAGRPVPGRDPLTAAHIASESELRGGPLFCDLVAADAGERLARHGREPAAHDLQRAP